MNRQAVHTEQAPAALGPYSQAIVAHGFVFCSGTAGIDPSTGVAAEGIEAQTEQALRNLATVLEAAGTSMDGLVKTTIFYSDVSDFGKLNEVYARHMPDPPPARSAPANISLPRGLLISIDAIAVLTAGGTVDSPRAGAAQASGSSMSHALAEDRQDGLGGPFPLARSSTHLSAAVRVRATMPRRGTTGCDVRCGANGWAGQATPGDAVAVVRLGDAAAGWLRGQGGGGDDGAQTDRMGSPSSGSGPYAAITAAESGPDAPD